MMSDFPTLHAEYISAREEFIRVLFAKGDEIAQSVASQRATQAFNASSVAFNATLGIRA